MSALKNLLHNPPASEGTSLHPPHHHHKHKKPSIKKALRKISKGAGISGQKVSSSKQHVASGGPVSLAERKGEVMTGAALVGGEVRGVCVCLIACVCICVCVRLSECVFFVVYIYVCVCSWEGG